MNKNLLIILFFFLPFFVFALDKIEINTASLKQLDEIIGIGPALAQRIIDARPFASVDDLIRVKGIGEKTLQKIKDQGLAYVENPNNQIPITNQTPWTPAGGLPEGLHPNDQKVTTQEQPTTPQDSQEARPPESTVEVGPPPTYPTGIVFNEILPSPEGPDETEEWIVTTIQPIPSAYL